jgi:hypothetical protein
MPAAVSVLWSRKYGNVTWDGVVRASGIAALSAIPVALFVPEVSGLVGFGVITIWVNGPISPVLPATYEPLLMLFGRVYPPFAVAAVGVAGTLYVEYLNYHLYGRVMGLGALTGIRESSVVGWMVALFRRAPFFTVWLCSWSPLPYWPMRFISPLAGYAISRHLWATFLGRLPRLWFVAWLGLWWNISMEILVLVSAGSIGIALVVYAARRVPKVSRGPGGELVSPEVAEF